MKYTLLYVLLLSLFFNNSEAQSTASKQVKTFTIECPQLNTSKKIWVYLPSDYKKSSIAYPVIYMHDAQNLFDAETSYAGEWKVDEFMDKLSDNQSIIIGIEHGNEKRISELTPYKHEKYGGGQGDKYLSFIVDTLKPHIDKTYRTINDAEHTTLFGASLGGLISFYGIIKFPETFGKAGAFSPSFWINEEIYDLIESSTIDKSKRFYFLVGTDEGEDMVPNQERMVRLLKEKGVKENQIKNVIIEGGKHNEEFWGSHFGDAYLWLNN